MSTTTGKISASTAFTLANSAPFSGAAVARLNLDEAWGPGTGTRQYDRLSIYSYTLAPSATQILDLQTALMQDMTALGLAELRALQIVVDPTNVGLVTVAPGAADPWVSWLQVGSVMGLAPNSNHLLVAPIDGSYLVGPTNKTLLFTNLDAVNAATITVLVAGVSA